LATRAGEVIMQSDQRIGFDPLTGKFRSWLFDSDGGFSEGSWTQLDGEWMVSTRAIDPTGLVGTASVTFTPVDDDRFRMVGTDRIIGEERAPDFDVTVTRAPPKPLAREKVSTDQVTAPEPATVEPATVEPATVEPAAPPKAAAPAAAKPAAPVKAPAPKKAPAQAPR
jgi:hypothetical protein